MDEGGQSTPAPCLPAGPGSRPQPCHSPSGIESRAAALTSPEPSPNSRPSIFWRRPKGKVAMFVLESGREADLSALKTGAQAPPRLSRANGDQERPQGRRASARARSQAPDRLVPLTTRRSASAKIETVLRLQQDDLGIMSSSPVIETLTRRADFLAAARAFACAQGAVSAQARFRDDHSDRIRIGFTATRRIGGAVVRNRAKRRLREAARAVAPLHVVPGCDYVLLARGGTPTRPWPSLLDDMARALHRLSADLRRAEAASLASDDAPGDS